MKMVIELSSVYKDDVEELQKLTEEIEDLTRYATNMENDTVLKVLKAAKYNRQQHFKKNLSEILERLSGEDLLLCSTSREEEDENQGFRW